MKGYRFGNEMRAFLRVGLRGAFFHFIYKKVFDMKISFQISTKSM